LYFSPWRKALYLKTDPQVQITRDNLSLYRATLAHIDQKMVLSPVDSSTALAEMQTKAWQEYRVYRNRLTELAGAYTQASPDGFFPWAFSMRWWLIPGLFGFVAVGGLLSAWMVWRQPPIKPALPSRPLARPEFPPAEKTQVLPLDQFQEAVRRIADIQAQSPVRQKARRMTQAESKPLEGLDEERIQPPPPARPSPKPDETAYLDVLSGWDEPGPSLTHIPDHVYPSAESFPSDPLFSPPSSSLIMEDEDNPTFDLPPLEGPEEGGTDPGWGVLPPTTQFEKLERQKDEIMRMVRKGLTSSEISHRLKMGQDQVELIIRMRRERG